jgi:hypothetical protein
MFNKPSRQHTAKALSVNEEFWNKIGKPRTFFAQPFSVEFACVKFSSAFTMN